MKRMLLAELAVFVHFDTICIVLLVLHCVVVSLLTFCTSQRNFYSHSHCPPFNLSFQIQDRPEFNLKLRAVAAPNLIIFIKLLNNCILQRLQSQDFYDFFSLLSSIFSSSGSDSGSFSVSCKGS